MQKLRFIMILLLLLPLVALTALDALADGRSTKQLDKVEKDATVLRDDKQGKPPAKALDPVRFEFVRSNMVSTFYHELAHALVDTMGLAVLGQEEDAADVFSVLMVERLLADADALATNKGAALAYEVDATAMNDRGRTWDWADEHGPDMQRYYNIVCLTYGRAPERRADFANEMKLPEDRAALCEDEYDLALRSWAPIFSKMAGGKTAEPMRFRHSARSPLQIRAAEVIHAEVKRVNEAFNFPKRLRVVVKRCGRGSDFYAYYSTSRKKITICTNYIDELYRDAPI